MKRVGGWLARGIYCAVAFLLCGPLSDSTVSRRDLALSLVRSQNHAALFTLAGERIQGFFHAKSEDDFIDDIFSLSGKWKAVTRSRESYERHVRQVFEKHLFDPAEFERVLDQIRADYAHAVTTSENRLLVALHRDARAERPGLTPAVLRAEYEQLAGALAPSVLRDLGMNTVSIAGAEAASMILVGALTSAGILGGSVAAGTAGAGWTFGVSLVVGIVVGLGIDAVVGGACEDAVRWEIRLHLNGLRNRVIDDVYFALGHALASHRRLQEECVRELYDGGWDERVAHRR